MVRKKTFCLLLICVAILGCLSVPADAASMEAQVFELTGRRATRHFDFDVPANTIMEASSDFPMEYGETVTITASYSPSSASMDFGLIDADDIFYPVRVNNGSINQTLIIDERGNYTLAIRNNSSYTVHVTGFVNY
jgi:hypothetical protein